MSSPGIDTPDSCEMCRGTGRIAELPWGVRPPKKPCPECGGNGWRDGIDLTQREELNPNPVGVSNDGWSPDEYDGWQDLPR